MNHDPPVRVLIVSDTHGFLDPQIAGLAQDCAVVLHAGDIGGGEVLDALAAGGARVLAVRGNNDTPEKWGLEHRSTLEDLPWEAHLELPGGLVAMVHGHRAVPARNRHRRLREDHPNARLVVYGHSHRRVLDEAAQPWVLNPGVAGRARTFGGPSCYILSAGAHAWSLMPHHFPNVPGL